MPLPIEQAAWESGDYPWDRWEEHAGARGVPADVAQLGRAVMREAYQHQWGARLACRFGWAALDLAENPDWQEVPGLPGVRTSRPGTMLRWKVDLASCEAMIRLALEAPAEASANWQRQLDTDGGRRAGLEDGAARA